MAINGLLKWGLMPFWYDAGGTYVHMNQMQYGSGGNYLISANSPIRYQVVWSGTGGDGATIDENYNANSTNDIVNIVFRVFVSTTYPVPGTADMELVGVLRKSRDVPNRNLVDGSVDASQRFTVDIAPLLADQLSYSLVPIGKGTWQSFEWGGMNGGLTNQDNVTAAVSKFAQTMNGTFRAVRIVADAEVIQSDGSLLEQDIGFVSPPVIRVTNGVNQWDKDNSYYNQTFRLKRYTPSINSPKRIMSNCPNWSYNGNKDNGVKFSKPVREDEKAEWMYFYVSQALNAADPTDDYNLYEIYGEVYDSAGSSLSNPFVLADFTKCMDYDGPNHFAHDQHRVLAQNISVDWIKNNAYDPQNSSTAGLPLPYTSAYTWDSDTAYYTLYIRGHYQTGGGSWTSVIHSSTYYYEIDTEEPCGDFEFVRFHWLNTAGGIDSYTAKRNVSEGLSVSKETIERKAGDRVHFQEDKYDASSTIPAADYLSDSMRGGDVYKGGREVLSTNAEKRNSVYTEPLNNHMAKWLSEIATSPNVWIETASDVRSDAASSWHYWNDYLRPERIMYTPVIITNTDIETVNQEEGLVKINIQYTNGHTIITQRN